jgi:hypothetical protein|tara:strand:- start:908 stop:1081 length:174 start_codon:yes stop_codon:yes gene_type:complete
MDKLKFKKAFNKNKPKNKTKKNDDWGDWIKKSKGDLKNPLFIKADDISKAQKNIYNK